MTKPTGSSTSRVKNTKFGNNNAQRNTQQQKQNLFSLWHLHFPRTHCFVTSPSYNNTYLWHTHTPETKQKEYKWNKRKKFNKNKTKQKNTHKHMRSRKRGNSSTMCWDQTQDNYNNRRDEETQSAGTKPYHKELIYSIILLVAPWAGL